MTEPFDLVRFCSISRHVEKTTTGIYIIFRGFFFHHNAEIGKKILNQRAQEYA